MPAISLATVNKNIHLFVESGVFRKMSMHHGSVRVEINYEPHHHMVCSKCRKNHRYRGERAWFTAKRYRLPGGFLVERYAVDVIGVCASCQKS